MGLKYLAYDKSSSISYLIGVGPGDVSTIIYYPETVL